MFNTILIANRGEIACRIIKTARNLGIHTVAVYSSVDKNSLHVQLADSAYWIGESSAQDSYLNIENIIEAAKKSHAEAIHPGYGFLSENPLFAKACAAANITFIGPSIYALEAMASKQLAKQLLENTQVPLIPGYHGKEQNDDYLLAQAKKMKFPVLIKAANGGGGKGMRAVHQESDFFEALAGARREAKASFGDETMIIEKLLQNPRHIEVQIMADQFDHTIHLFERDCSMQRRHQKIIEEAPAPNLSPAARQKITKAACEVAQSIQYLGAGTVEFLMDVNEQFYFMEMNTRLQVEHPVTEMITGLDLVEWQLRIAANEPLPLIQDKIPLNGHALESRIYAEDPYQDFIPSIGQIQFLQEPKGEGIRIDTGITLSSTITQFYDPMIAKLIVWGEDRETALKRMQQALNHYFIGGVKTNIPFLQALCNHPKFQQAQLCTDFLSKESVQLAKPNQELALLQAVSFDYLKLLRSIDDPIQKDSFAWQIQGAAHWTWRYYSLGTLCEPIIFPICNEQFIIHFDKLKHHIRATLEEDCLTIELNYQQHHAVIDSNKEQLTIYTDQGTTRIERFSWSGLDTSSTHQGQLKAPMPATVVAILKNKGDAVLIGDRLMVLEAMKMEHTIHAPKDGILLDIFYSVGEQVDEGAELLSLSEDV